MTSGSEQDTVIENKISFIEEIVNVIYDLGRIVPDQSPRLTRVILKSLVVSLIKVKEEWEQADVGKLEKTIQRMKERDQELSAIIGHMADQLIGRVPIKPVETDQAKDALIIDLQQRHNDLSNRLKEATKHAGELVVVRDDLQKANAMYEMRIKEWQARNEQLVKDNNDLRMQVEHLEGEVEPNEQIEKLRQANADLIETRRSLIEDRDRRHEAAQSECLKKEHAIEQLELAKKELADRKVMIGDLKGKVEALDNMIATRDSRIQSLLEENVELSKAVELHKALDGDGIVYREANVADLMEQLEDAERLITEQSTELGELGDKVARLQKEKASADKSVDNLFKENDAQEETINRLQAEVDELSSQVSNLQNLVARPGLGVPFIKSIDKIAKERDEARASNKALSSVGESMFEENEALRKQNKELQETVITLQNQSNDLVAAQTRDMQRMTDRVREVEQHNDYLQTAIVRDAERVGVRIKGLEYEKRRLEVELGAKHSDIKELRKINKELEEERKERNAKIKELEEECEKVTLDRTDLVKQVRKAERHNKDLKGKLVEARTAIKELEDGHPPADIQARMIDQLQERNEKLLQENASLRQINRELAEGNRRLESELKARDMELAKRGKRIEDLRTTAEQQGEEIRQLENKIAVANEEAEQLEREAEQLTRDANRLERQLVKAQEFKQQLIDGLNFAFDGEVSAERLAGTLELLIRQEPEVREQVRSDLEFLRRRYTEKTDNLEQRKQDAIDRIKAAAPGSWKVVGARPLHEGKDDGDNEEASPEKEESRES